MNEKHVLSIFSDLFNRAKTQDEFEYICTLLRVRGAEDAGWDPLEETSILFNDMLGLAQAPLRSDTQVRLALLLYSHLTEVDAIYMILANLLRVTKGDRYSSDPFFHLYTPKNKPRLSQRPPSAKSVINDLVKHAKEQGQKSLEELLVWYFNDSIRNAFFHSDYIIYGDEFRTREASFQQKDRTYSPAMKLIELTERINRGLLFYQAFMDTFLDQTRSYKSEKQIYGRFGPNGESIPVNIMVGKGGLRGFQSVL